MKKKRYAHGCFQFLRQPSDERESIASTAVGMPGARASDVRQVSAHDNSRTRQASRPATRVVRRLVHPCPRRRGVLVRRRPRRRERVALLHLARDGVAVRRHRRQRRRHALARRRQVKVAQRVRHPARWRRRAPPPLRPGLLEGVAPSAVVVVGPLLAVGARARACSRIARIRAAGSRARARAEICGGGGDGGCRLGSRGAACRLSAPPYREDRCAGVNTFVSVRVCCGDRHGAAFGVFLLLLFGSLLR